MAKKYNTKRAEFNQKDYDKVEKYLTEPLKQAFRLGTIDLAWCETFTIPYIVELIKQDKYNPAAKFANENRGRNKGNKGSNKGNNKGNR